MPCSAVSGMDLSPGPVVPGDASPWRMALMIMRSLNDDGFDFHSGDVTPPEWSVNCRDGGICSDWRFVPLDPGQHRRIDAAHTNILTPHLRRTSTPAALGSETEFNQALYFG